jgi:hypothetical protein
MAETRKLKFLEWENDLAWIDKMKGHKWKDLLHKESAYWNKLVKQSPIRSKIPAFADELSEMSAYHRIAAFTIANGNIAVAITGGENYMWRWKWERQWRSFTDIDYADGHVWVTETDKKNQYASRLRCMKTDGTVLWSKDYVSDQVVVKNGLCYFVGVKYPFHTDELFVCDAFTGKNEEVLMVEKSPENFLILISEAGKTIYVKSSNWKGSTSWRIEGRKCVRVFADTKEQLLLGRAPDGEECALVHRTPHGPLLKVGEHLKKMQLPKEDPYWFDLHSGLALTVKEGERTIYLCSPDHKPKRLHSIVAGDIYTNPWAAWFDELVQIFIVRSPDGPPYALQYVRGGDSLTKIDIAFLQPPNPKKGKTQRALRHPFRRAKPPPALVATKFHATSRDGTKVPWLLVHQKNTKKPRGLIGYVYSAYGSDTLVSWPHFAWTPLLRRGWAIAYCFARGGGDNGDEWMEAGQGRYHIRTVEDFEAVIRKAQDVTHLGPQQTVIYGRSAGGMMVGSTVARNPDGQLMGACFTEVPFVDTLWTQTNYEVPLTPSGMSEYGNPIDSMRNYAAMMKMSPMYKLDADGAPGVFVLCRTGLKDLQVMPSEPFKWIQRLRGVREPPAGKYLAFEADEAHVYRKKGLACRAVDLAILETWLEKKIAGLNIKMAQQQKKQQRKQEGGRRRKTHRRRSARRHTRRQQRK